MQQAVSRAEGLLTIVLQTWGMGAPACPHSLDDWDGPPRRAGCRQLVRYSLFEDNVRGQSHPSDTPPIVVGW